MLFPHLSCHVSKGENDNLKILGIIICTGILIFGVWTIISEFFHIVDRFDIDERSQWDKK